MSTTKAEVEALLRTLPDNCSFEDIQCYLYVLSKIRRGLETAAVNGTISQEEAEKRLNRWLMK